MKLKIAKNWPYNRSKYFFKFILQQWKYCRSKNNAIQQWSCANSNINTDIKN